MQTRTQYQRTLNPNGTATGHIGEMHMKYLPHATATFPGLLRKAGGIVAATALAGLALMFSAVLLAILLCVGTLALAYLWWKTRELRKQMRNFPPHGAAMEQEEFEGEVIEGEVIRVEEPNGRIKH